LTAKPLKKSDRLKVDHLHLRGETLSGAPTGLASPERARFCAVRHAREISVLRVSMATLEETNAALVEGDESLRRRDFINIAAVSFAGVGAVAVALPLINQMNPPADVLALASTEVDISKIAPGQAIKTSWRKQPVFVRNLTPQEVQQANAVPLSDLRDPQSLAERTKPGKENWLVTLGVCTHLGCVPLGVAAGENRGEYGGYFCPCHGSHYDTAARIRKGPAPTNLVVPEYNFTSDTVVTIG
jgi:ubiquinol-cytochrome c reductase iron-sulfur subunit